MRKLIIAEFFILLVGTLFAWTNLVVELVSWLQQKKCLFSCSAGLQNPFLTPCFYGALCFTLAFMISVLILKRFKKESSQ